MPQTVDMKVHPEKQAAGSLVSGAERVRQLFELQRRDFLARGPAGYDARMQSLAKLERMVVENEAAIADAISADFGHRSRFETSLTEVYTVLADIRHARRHLRRWMRPRRVATSLEFLPASNRIVAQPLGIVGIISPWNYPLYLAFSPAVAALAAGNRVLLKPSELTPRTSALLERMVESAFAKEEFAVVPGGAETGRAMAETPFQHLLFTGSTAVGREVAIAAAKNLTPVTLELGGKSPAIISADASLAIAAKRIAVGKLVNAGQTCIAPDYVLLPRGSETHFVAELRKAVGRLYPTLAENPDYTAIINDRHFERLRSTVSEAESSGAKVIRCMPNGEDERSLTSARKMPLTIILDPAENLRVMRDELFGPILPVCTYSTEDELAHKVMLNPSPLALYWFGIDAAPRERLLSRVAVGGVAVNDTLWQICQHSLPFGGVGTSGMGAYHGEHGFRTFSKMTGVFLQARWNGLRLLYPPFGKWAHRTLGALRKLV